MRGMGSREVHVRASVSTLQNAALPANVIDGLTFAGSAVFSNASLMTLREVLSRQGGGVDPLFWAYTV